MCVVTEKLVLSGPRSDANFGKTIEKPPSRCRGTPIKFFAKSMAACSASRPAGQDELLASMWRLAGNAISVGAPLYNSGQAGQCASLYKLTLQSLLIHHMDADESSELKKMIEASLKASEAQTGAAHRAWTLRVALNAAMAHAARHHTPPRTDRGHTAVCHLCINCGKSVKLPW